MGNFLLNLLSTDNYLKFPGNYANLDPLSLITVFDSSSHLHRNDIYNCHIILNVASDDQALPCPGLHLKFHVFPTFLKIHANFKVLCVAEYLVDNP